MDKPKILIVIPARGGSKGIPRKNLRNLAGLPLIYYSIKTALHSTYSPHVYVSTDDDEIASIAQKSGARVHKRAGELATDRVTLDPVIYDVFAKCMAEGHTYDLVITVQPTSPLLKTTTLDEAIQIIWDNKGIDSLISACDDTHLTWSMVDNRYVPNYKERVNRQYLTPVFKETGSFFMTRSAFVTKQSRLGKNISLYQLEGPEAIDIDTYEDWMICEFYLLRKVILFVVTGYKEVGLGHVYNALSIANEILNHELVFLVDAKSQMAYDKISEYNYKVILQTATNIHDDIDAIHPYMVINDRLDTTAQDIQALKRKGYKIVNFEDLGEGSAYADLVINAMYPEKEEKPGHYFGHKYFCLKSEFYLSGIKTVQKEVKHVLLTFGGVDPNNFTLKVLRAIYSYCLENGISIEVITGFGYNRYDTLEAFPKVAIHKSVGNISDYMAKADIAFTSAGRTTFELGSLGIPAIVLCQNSRETTHFFAYEKYGFINLGLGEDVNESQIFEVFSTLVTDVEKRKQMNKTMLGEEIKNGKKNVIRLIESLLV